MVHDQNRFKRRKHTILFRAIGENTKVGPRQKEYRDYFYTTNFVDRIF